MGGRGDRGIFQGGNMGIFGREWGDFRRETGRFRGRKRQISRRSEISERKQGDFRQETGGFHVV